MLRTLALVAALGGVAHADYLSRVVAAARAEVSKAIAARAPRYTPPVPVKVTWKPVRLGSLDLGAPLIAMESADLDGDGKGELYLVTSRELIAVGIDKKKAKVLARAPYTGAPSVRVPRDLFGTAVASGKELVAKCSGWASELRATWSGKALVATLGDASAGNLVCDGERLVAVPGRNHFGDPASPIYDVHCRELTDREGKPLAVRATLTGDGMQARAGDREFALKDYGVAFAIGDVDRDGTPELVVTAAGAPGDPDAVKVITLGGDEKKGLFRKTYQGGVAGVAIVDGDGDGISEVIAAVRLVGSPRVDVWRLN